MGAGLRVRLPSAERDFRVQGRALIAELWQAARGPNVPWTFTGSLFAGFALEGAVRAYLLNWQNRFYLFEKRQSIDDQHIQRYFLPHARAFGQSGQMGRVEFDYEGRRWQMVDIGRSQAKQPRPGHPVRWHADCQHLVPAALENASYALWVNTSVYRLTKFGKSVSVLFGRSWCWHNPNFLPKGGFAQG